MDKCSTLCSLTDRSAARVHLRVSRCPGHLHRILLFELWNRSSSFHAPICLQTLFMELSRGMISRQNVQVLQVFWYADMISKASLLICVKGIINCFALMLVLPIATKILDRYLSPVQRDIRMALGCACLLMAAFVFMCVASHPAVFVVGVALVAFGGGFYAALRSVGSALVGPSHVGLLNTTITLTQGAGLMISGPLLAGLFRAGMAWEGVWMGLPWMAGVILFAATILTVYCLQVQG